MPAPGCSSDTIPHSLVTLPARSVAHDWLPFRSLHQQSGVLLYPDEHLNVQHDSGGNGPQLRRLLGLQDNGGVPSVRRTRLLDGRLPNRAAAALPSALPAAAARAGPAPGAVAPPWLHSAPFWPLRLPRAVHHHRRLFAPGPVLSQLLSLERLRRERAQRRRLLPVPGRTGDGRVRPVRRDAWNALRIVPTRCAPPYRFRSPRS